MFPKRDLNYIEKPIRVELAKDGSNKDDFYCPCGTLDTKSFARNYGGYPRSDLAIINEQTDLNVAKAMLSNLVQIPDGKPNPQSDAEQILSLRSKYCQSIDEQVKYTERMLTLRDEKIAQLRARQIVADKEKQTIDFTENKDE